MIIKFDREDSGRWVAEFPEIYGCVAYGDTEEEAAFAALRLAFDIVKGRVPPSVLNMEVPSDQELIEMYGDEIE